VVELIDELGPEAATLLVPYVEPGEGAGPEQLYRAETITHALEDLPNEATVQPLLHIATTGTVQARVHAVRLLGTAPDSRRAISFLMQVVNGGDELEVEAAAALARSADEAAREVLRVKLVEARPVVARGILEVWARMGTTPAGPAVLDLARRPDRAAPVLGAIVAYWKAVPTTATTGTREALIQLALAPSSETPVRTLALEALIDLELPLDSDDKERLEVLTDSAEAGLRETSLICLALAGDRGARRTLVREADDEVDRNEDYPPAYEQRGDLYFRLRDFPDAARDYRKAIDLLDRGQRAPGVEIQVKLARAYARADRLRNAYETLQAAGLRREELAELANDPHLAELREHSRYGRIFE